MLQATVRILFVIRSSSVVQLQTSELLKSEVRDKDETDRRSMVYQRLTKKHDACGRYPLDFVFNSLGHNDPRRWRGGGGVHAVDSYCCYVFKAQIRSVMYA